MGTPGFTAPERIRGDPPPPRPTCGRWAPPCTRRWKGAGRSTAGATPWRSWPAIANEEPPRPRSAGPLGHVIEALLHRNPQARPDAAAAGRLTGRRRGQNLHRRGLPGSRARAGAPLPAAPPDLAAAGPKTQVPADGVSRPEAPWPDGQWAGVPWPGATPPEGTPSGGRWPESQGPESLGPQSQGPQSQGRPSAAGQVAGPQAACTARPPRDSGEGSPPNWR